ncbi:rho GTPase-activating protein 25 isoform X2 [Rhinatrema bivittatum]|uniref:rho GTPase-activating protein 25 isoform X2 n=1 Tax=Rhinatrema bivittatum TaxID=194408 RepID=UPI00112809A4|nr:rho GTPase-activating protein 25 isoform X2 [Rhinatrema bivittatum]
MSLKLPRHWDFNLKTDAGKLARSRSVMTGDQTAGSNQPSSPNRLDWPLKTGWLKKQRSIVKNWQQRYFVLKGQHLYYYKDEEETKPQGCITLQRSTVREVAMNPEDAGKFIFEIIPGIFGDQTRAGQDSCILMANTQTEMEEWVKAIKRVTGAPSGVVFGQRLADTIAYEKKFGQHLVPILMEKCADFIREQGMNEEGVFRLPGQDNLVKQLREAFDAGERPSFDRDTDVHTVASLFKLYLRELPEPVIPWAQYEDFLLSAQLMSVDEVKGHQALMNQVVLLPRDNYNLLSFICRFLHEIQLNSSVNKMSVDNLATVIGVNLIRPKLEDPVMIMKGTPQIQKLMTAMISHHEKLFPKSKDALPPPAFQKSDSKKITVPRSSVGWDAAEEMPPARGEILRKSQSKDSVDLDRSVSSRLNDVRSPFVESHDDQPEDCLETWKTSPRKRTQTLPSRKCSVTCLSQGETSNSHKGEIFSSDFWTSNLGCHTDTGSPVESHKRSQSGEFFSFFDFHRASTYDNVPASRVDSAEGTCTNLVNANSNKENQSPSYLQKEAHSPLSGTREPGTGSESSPSLEDIVQELKKEIEVQRKEYEERIKSLEKENYDVWAKVVRLKEELKKEKEKNLALEITLQDEEHSRSDAEKRNEILEQEMQMFLKSMREPSAKTE